MSEWEDKFNKETLDKGIEFYLNKKVVDLKETQTGYSAAVLARKRHEVSVKMLASGVQSMSCKCPVARSGRNCEHMAALMYAIDAKKAAEQSEEAEKILLEQWKQVEEELSQEKQRKEAEKKKKKKKLEAEKAEEERRREEEKKAAEEERRREEEKKAAEEQRREEEKKAEEERKRQEEERAARRLAREKRKMERASKKEEQKRRAQEAARAEYEKQLAEEARREKIRQQKAEEAQRRAEKRRKELEEQEKRIKAEEKRRKAEERRRKAEEKRRIAEEERRRAEKRQIREEKMRAEKARKEAEEKERQEKEKRRKEYTLLGNSWEDETDIPDSENTGREIQNLEDYRYFDGTRIRGYMKASKKTIVEGERLYNQGKIVWKKMLAGFHSADGGRIGQMDAVGKEDGREFPMTVLFTRKDILAFECGCRKCSMDYYAQYNTQKTDCPYKAGALKMLEEYLAGHNIGDSTDLKGQRFLTAFEKKRANHVMADASSKEESLRLIPRLTQKEGKLSLSFKVGANKLFVIKKLDVFCENVRNSATDTYGSNTDINHDLNNFTDSGKGWIRLINQIVREEKEFEQRLFESRQYYGNRKESVGSTLNLFGWRLDEFYEKLGKESIEFEDKDGYEKKKAILTCADCNPRVTMRISEDMIMGDKQFHGIKVEGSIPELYYGTDTAYYISDNHLNRLGKEFLEQIQPLAELSKEGSFLFRVGRNRISQFYSQIMPQLQEIADITETQPEKFRSYVLPEARFIFYLDARENDAFCRIYAWYGDKEVSVFDVLTTEKWNSLEAFRDGAKEQEILFYAQQWFPEMNWEQNELSCGGNESLIYQLMKTGTGKLMELGEVRCTQRFLRYHNVSRVKVSVGVSVSSNLLELDISTEDIPASELLGILKSYRIKQKYYRLKDGAFVDLEDSSLEMLAELSQAMNLKDKELLKGKTKLPIYRALYIDRLLEENEDVYSSRDSHFRGIVKEFKTVREADFEEPASLSKVMRKCQKDGYKWLRTLETWQFGGILADDMGLGKTLQVIAVILAAKEEGKKGTSLVITPASLVFNWAAELEKFAPDLKVSLITGTQEERHTKIEDYQQADVLVTSYDLLKRDIVLYEDKEFFYEMIDEAQYIKNHTTAAAKAVKVIHSRIRYALTGTPIENRLSELWSIFDYLMPGFLYSYEVFKREMETPIVKNDDEKAMKRLQKMVGPFILRRLKENVLKDLPEKLEEYRYVKLEDAQQKVYDGQVLHMKELIAHQDADEFNKNKLQILAELTRLRQICCDPSLCFENYKGGTAKLEACLELIQSAMDGGHRILVFSQFTSMLEILQRELEKLEISYFTITGSTSKEKRLELVKRFNEGNVPVFLISLKAGGVGLNLTGADVVIHYDPWWNLAAQNQATDRAHRIGQTKKVTVYKLIARYTIEEKIQKLQEAKKNLADQVMSGEMGSLGSMSREEILELLEV